MNQMKTKTYIIITSIASSTNQVLQNIAEKSEEIGFNFIVIGDGASPSNFELSGCDFYSLEQQLELEFKFAKVCLTKHYARKNIGYLIAMSEGAEYIIETDDDNIPFESFWQKRSPKIKCKILDEGDWVNVYKYFSNSASVIWPRGLPLDKIHHPLPPQEKLAESISICPIQQGLADENPDVDAIYRLVLPLPQTFRENISLALGRGTWCPFNSQNTVWFPPAYPLMYLPAYCSFRMTDIWRSFVAQRICWENGWRVLFHSPTVYQERNTHNLMKDFEDEIPGYLNNKRICESLSNLKLHSGELNIHDNLRKCYEVLIRLGVVKSEEAKLLEAWLSDIDAISRKSLEDL